MSRQNIQKNVFGGHLTTEHNSETDYDVGLKKGWTDCYKNDKYKAQTTARINPIAK